MCDFEKDLSQNNFIIQCLYIDRNVLNARNWRHMLLVNSIQTFSIVADECQGTNSAVHSPGMHTNMAWTIYSILPCNIWLFSKDCNINANRYIHVCPLLLPKQHYWWCCINTSYEQCNVKKLMWNISGGDFTIVYLKNCYVCL